MAKSRRKSGSGTRGRFKRKRLGKGWSTIHKPIYGAKPKPSTSTAEASTDKPSD